MCATSKYKQKNIRKRFFFLFEKDDNKQTRSCSREEERYSVVFLEGEKVSIRRSSVSRILLSLSFVRFFFCKLKHVRCCFEKNQKKTSCYGREQTEDVVMIKLNIITFTEGNGRKEKGICLLHNNINQ